MLMMIILTIIDKPPIEKIFKFSIASIIKFSIASINKFSVQ